MAVKDEYKFSIIVPVYNTEAYLTEAIESVVNQDEGYFLDTQLILVNDGSTDRSGSICEKYAQKYPDNVVYIYQPNSGVSAARNRGLEVATGEYIGVLDSDDRYQLSLLKKVYDYFGIVQNEVDVMAVPMHFFGRQTGQHRLNNKFKLGNKVLDVTVDWKDVILSTASAFIRRSAIEELELRFNPNLVLAEDANFITRAIMRKQRYALMSGASYEYRKRDTGTSAIDSFQNNPEAYMPVLRHGWQPLLEDFRDAQGTAAKYVQNVVMHDMEWRLKQVNQSVLDDAQLNEYMGELYNVVQQIDDDVIISQRFLGYIHTIYALTIKHGEDVPKQLEIKGKALYFNDIKIISLTTSRIAFKVEIMERESGRLKVSGIFRGALLPGMEYGAFINKKFTPMKAQEAPQYRWIMNNGKVVAKTVLATADIPVKPGQNIGFGCRIPQLEVRDVCLGFGLRSKMPPFPKGYRMFSDCMVVNASNMQLHVRRNTPSYHIRRELIYLRKLAYYMLKTGTVSRSVPVYRLAAIFLEKLKHDKIWIISDRRNLAGDNGEAFFKYVMQHKPEGVKVFFSIKKNSPDYARLRKIGPVIDQESRLGRLLFLLSDEIISAQADEVVLDAFGGKTGLAVRDLYHYRFTFLQHGITQGDLSGWLNKFNKDIGIFVTASAREQASIAQGDYLYTEGQAKLTGFPRFDLLENRAKNKLIISPTWRSYLAGPVDPNTGARKYFEGFKDSQYYQFFQGILLDAELNAALQRNGFQAEFLLHPNLSANIKDFQGTENVKIIAPPHSYTKIFAEGSILVTDYSSIHFDFAYLHKPVVYAQYDKDAFFQKHTVQAGYFSFEDDAFGPVCTTKADTVKALVEILDAKAQIPPKYQERIDAFYAFHDRDNSQRVLAELLK